MFVLQLKHKTPTESVDLALDIIANQFEQFTKKHYDKLFKNMVFPKNSLKKQLKKLKN
jgi:RNA polymerase sigma-54 factor